MEQLSLQIYQAVSKSNKTNLTIRDYPQYVKYMGSKSKILDFVVEGINKVHVANRPICDLFAGSCSLSGAIGHQATIISNDIQAYSAAIASSYLIAYANNNEGGKPEAIISEAETLVNERIACLPPDLDSSKHTKRIADFVACEERNRSLIDKTFDFHYHLFTRYYSGTWWSAEQCIWIDALREVAENHRDQPYYPVILTSLMHAMAYTSQGTGHYAQFRDATSRSSMLDIAIYRGRSLKEYFTKKYSVTYAGLPEIPPVHNHIISTSDFKECLGNIPQSTIYADPPYCIVHYSRFYHALETLVLYDFPPIQRIKNEFVKGRYREYRHQSPFCIKTQVNGAFEDMFQSVKRTESNLVLSYSNTGLIGFDELHELAAETLGNAYKLTALDKDHIHMTMGRKEDRQRNVKECLILAKRK